jgi:tetratricopeptide repeat protein 21B
LIEEEQYDAAQQQLAIVEELHESSSSVAMMHYIKAALLRRDPNKTSDAVQHLKKAYTLHVKTVENLFYGTDFLIQLNPDFLLSIAEEYFYHHPEESPIIQADLLRVLTSVVDACPGLLPALYRLANVHYTMGDLKTATATLRQIIDHVDPTYVDAYLLLAQIELKQDNQVQAAQWLEMGLSYNFQVRDHPLYHLLLARIQRLHKKDYEAALASLRNALVLSGMRPSSSGGLKRPPKAHFFSLQEKATAYIELFHVLMASDKKAEAGHVIQEALQELRGTTQEGLVLLAQVDYLLNEDDIESALNRLRSLPASHPQYLKAHEKMALIYLHRLRDEHNYLKCYKEIARQQPNVANLTNLGDAHLVLHQADLAVSAYEEALKLEPRNSKLASKIGAALVLTHQVSPCSKCCRAQARQLVHCFYLLFTVHKSFKLLQRRASRSVEQWTSHRVCRSLVPIGSNGKSRTVN